MKGTFYRLLKLISPYKQYAALNVLFNVLSIIFSVFSIAMVIPFLNMIFGMEALVTEVPEFTWSKDVLEQYFYYYMSSVIIDYGNSTMLILISIGTIIAFFFKNLLGIWQCGF